MRKIGYIFLFFQLFLGSVVYSSEVAITQEGEDAGSVQLIQDTVIVDTFDIVHRYASLPVDTLQVQVPIVKIFDPAKAAWYAAIVPGLGQIYNQQYWKLPILYGGAMGLGYAISWNNRMYVDYKKAYIDLVNEDPDSQSYEALLPDGVVIDDSNRDYYERVFENKKDSYLRNRDLSSVFMGVLYVLSIVDAYVDANMRDYDIGPDLSVKIAPAVFPSTPDQALDSSLGLRCKINF